MKTLKNSNHQIIGLSWKYKDIINGQREINCPWKKTFKHQLSEICFFCPNKFRKKCLKLIFSSPDYEIRDIPIGKDMITYRGKKPTIIAGIKNDNTNLTQEDGYYKLVKHNLPTYSEFCLCCYMIRDNLKEKKLDKHNQLLCNRCFQRFREWKNCKINKRKTIRTFIREYQKILLEVETEIIARQQRAIKLRYKVQKTKINYEKFKV